MILTTLIEQQIATPSATSTSTCPTSRSAMSVACRRCSTVADDWPRTAAGSPSPHRDHCCPASPCSAASPPSSAGWSNPCLPGPADPRNPAHLLPGHWTSMLTQRRRAGRARTRRPCRAGPAALPTVSSAGPADADRGRPGRPGRPRAPGHSAVVIADPHVQPAARRRRDRHAGAAAPVQHGVGHHLADQQHCDVDECAAVPWVWQTCTSRRRPERTAVGSAASSIGSISTRRSPSSRTGTRRGGWHAHPARPHLQCLSSLGQ